MASRSGCVEYRAFLVCWYRSHVLPKPTGARRLGGKMDSPSSLNTVTTLAIGTSNATAKATMPPIDVPQVKSNRRPIGSPRCSSITCRARAVTIPGSHLRSARALEMDAPWSKSSDVPATAHPLRITIAHSVVFECVHRRSYPRMLLIWDCLTL